MSVKANYAATAARVLQVCQELGRPVPRLLAVGKTHPAALLRDVYDCGQRYFGENYVRELLEKSPEMPADVRWHLIGHLQSNKVKPLVKGVPSLECVESVDSEKLATKLDQAVMEFRPTRSLRVFVQVNTSEEDSKSGCDESLCVPLVRFIHEKCPHLTMAGLMTIGKYDTVADVYFEKLASLKTLVEREVTGLRGLELSMGMSCDWDRAVRFGSTNIRVGSTIFGTRDYSKMHE